MIHFMKIYEIFTIFFDMLANVGTVRVNENINEKRENLCSFFISSITIKKIIKNCCYVPRSQI